MNRCAIAVLLVLAVASCVHMDPNPRRLGAQAPAPALEADRKVNEQTCTQGIDLKAGNLRCN